MKTKNNNWTPKALISLFSLFLLTLCISACSKNDSAGLSVSAYVMAANTAEASVPQDFYVDNNKINTSGMAYTQATAYTDVKAGDHQLQFKTSGSATVNSSTTLSAAGSNYYSVFYTDDKSTVTTKDDHSAPKSNKARVRFINLSSALNSSVDFGISSGSKLASGLAYKAASAYYDVDAATTFSLYAAGSSTVALNIPATIQAGHIYTIFISGATQATISYHVLVQD
ncbi:DUF4397 domain-containing protein [Mucilaginibacter sp. UR6-11]|uniref:DUF4397 domain-containing protein n=1 Tax=Mucilaginibacter sp. UR6-11 TaxID=1435644 RepID=UPI001E30E323|nr:DUF4397 domain-containing protein [Mucilaginibacter sp. UR6-11]MCC8427065.1 DUF4397 domain-containing protein [Mucilaginibacter sp. UR6-11]